jgi:hypothetical protein
VVVLYRLCSFWFVVAAGGVAAAFGSVSVRDLVAETPDR